MERDPGDWRQKYPISFIPYPMNGYRLVVADIDGTLVTRTREITPGVLSAVRAAQFGLIRRPEAAISWASATTSASICGPAPA